jgi:hypothetical protein
VGLLRKTLLAVVAASWFLGSPAAQQRPLPERDALFARTTGNLERSQSQQNAYAYRERRRVLHTNPFGRLGSGDGVEVFQVTPHADGVVTRQLIERDGMPVKSVEVERSTPRPRHSRRSVVADTAAALELEVDHRETLNGRDIVVITFGPRPNVKPETRQGRLARLFSGRIYVDEADAEVLRVEATAIDDITYGLGLVARLGKGATVTLVRERVDRDAWLPTSIRIVGDGRAMLLRKLRVDHLLEWFAYTRVLEGKSG